jgi:hypothetical protein
MDILINISEVAIITGHNTYKTKREFLIDFWKKNHKEDYKKYIEITQFKKETDHEIVNKISEKNQLDILPELKKCMYSKNTGDLQKIKQQIFQKVEHISEAEKTEITKSITNLTNTRFGVRNETDVLKVYMDMTGNQILKDNKYHKKVIFQEEQNDITVSIGGKIDGIQVETGLIIEIKNRVSKLFYALRDYEKVQIMCYMHLFTSKKGHLVEAYKKKDSTEINIIEVDYDTIFMNEIIEKIKLFSEFYYIFLHDHDLKMSLLSTSAEIDWN